MLYIYSMKQFRSLNELLNHFYDERVCRDYLVQQRWNGKPVCVHCGHDEKVWTIDGGKRFKCPACNKKFSVTVGTVFEHIRIPLNKAFAAVYLATAHKKGISSCQLARDLGITQKSAWFALHRIREMLKEKSPAMLEGPVQADETFVGGKNKNRHADKKIENSQGRSVKDKTPVFGLVCNGQVNTSVIPDTKGKTLKPIIKQMVKEGAIVITDEWNGYSGLDKKFQHEVLKHNENQFVKNGFHTNSIEGFWSLMKRGIYGIYHSVSAKHLQRYSDEFAYRYNTRGINDRDRFSHTLTRLDGSLTYKKLIAK